MKFLLDSVIAIDHFNNISCATDFIAQHQTNIVISVITRSEVLTGFNSKNDINIAQQLFDQFIQYPLTIIEADLAASLQREYKWKLPDAFQIAIAKHRGLQLVTRNTKDFNPKKFSFVIVPYTI